MIRTSEGIIKHPNPLYYELKINFTFSLNVLLFIVSMTSPTSESVVYKLFHNERVQNLSPNTGYRSELA